jgi:hypothetical protein
MGNFPAKNIIKTKTSFDTTVINTAVNSFRQEMIVAYQSTIQTANEVDVTAQNLKGCKIVINVATSINDTAQVTLAQFNDVKVTNTLSTQITNDISKQLQQQNENFGLGENVAKDTTTISNFIQNTIVNTFKETLNATWSTAKAGENKIKLDVKDMVCQYNKANDTGDIVVNSEILIDTSNKLQINQVMDGMVNNQEINSIMNKYNLTIKQSNSVSVWVWISIALIFLSIALLPLIISFVSSAFGKGDLGVNLIKILYLTLMIGAAIAGIVLTSNADVNWLYAIVASLAVILFFLLIILG